MNFMVRNFFIYAIFIIINGVVGKCSYLATGETPNEKTVEKYGTAKSRLNELKENGKAIISGFVKVNSYNIIHRVSEVPEEIDILNVAFQGFPEECSDTPCAKPKDSISCKTILCGNVNSLFDYKTVLGKDEWLEDVEQLRKRHKNIIVLFELSEEVLYLKDFPEAFNHIDEVIKFLDDYDFDGVNLRLNAKKLHEKKDKINEIINFYNDYAVKIKDKMGDNKLLSFTLNSVGAFSNLSTQPYAQSLKNDNSAYSPQGINENIKDDDLKKIAAADLAGIAIPIVNTLKEKINIIFIVDEYDLIQKKQKDIFFHVLYSYLEFIASFNIVIQFGIHLNNPSLATTLEDTDFIDSLIEVINKENEVSSVGCGIVFTSVGTPMCFFDANEYIPNIKKKLL